MLYDISMPTKLMDVLNGIEPSHWPEPARLNELKRLLITTSHEAEKVCSVLSGYMSSHKDPLTSDSPLPVLLGLFFRAQNEGAINTLRERGLPLVRELFRQSAAGNKGNSRHEMYALNVLTSFQQPEDLMLVKRLVDDEFSLEYGEWEKIFFNYTRQPARLAAKMVDALRDLRSAPTILLAYLGVVNVIARSSGLEPHPFDTEAGKTRLRHWLTLGNVNFHLHAVASLPFISEPDRTSLFELAQARPDDSVKIEIARAQAQLGDKNGINTLRFYCLSMLHSIHAQNYLYELGHLDKIPEKAKDPDFQAMSIMAQWLTEFGEYACSPNTLEIVDRRKLIWPGYDDELDLRLVKYIYEPNPYRQYTTAGVGLVGVGEHPILLSFVDTLSLSNEELYGLYYTCGDLYAHNGEMFSPQKAIKDGKAILAKYNDGF